MVSNGNLPGSRSRMYAPGKLFIPAGVHAMFDLIDGGRCLRREKLPADVQVALAYFWSDACGLDVIV